MSRSSRVENSARRTAVSQEGAPSCESLAGIWVPEEAPSGRLAAQAAFRAAALRYRPRVKALFTFAEKLLNSPMLPLLSWPGLGVRNLGQLSASRLLLL